MNLFFLERLQKLMLTSVNYKNQMADQNNMNMEHEQFDYDFDTLSMVSDDSGYYTIPFLPFNPVLPGVSPHPNHEQNLWTLEQKLNLNFRCWIKSSMNLRIIFNRIRRASNSSSKTPKDKRPNGPNWTRQKTGQNKNGPKTQNGPELVHNPFYNLFEFNLFMSEKLISIIWVILNGSLFQSVLFTTSHGTVAC